MSYPPPRPSSASGANSDSLQAGDHPTPASQQAASPLDWTNFMTFQTPPVSQAGPAGNGMPGATPGGYGSAAAAGGGGAGKEGIHGGADNYVFAQGAHVNQANRQGSMMFQQPPYPDQGGTQGMASASRQYPPPSPSMGTNKHGSPLTSGNPQGQGLAGGNGQAPGQGQGPSGNGKGKLPASPAPPMHRLSSGNLGHGGGAGEGLSLDPAAFSRDIRFQIPSFLSNQVGGAPTFPPGGEAWSGFSGPGMMGGDSMGGGGLTPGQLFNSMFNIPDGSPGFGGNSGGVGGGGWGMGGSDLGHSAWSGWDNGGAKDNQTPHGGMGSTTFYVNPNPSHNNLTSSRQAQNQPGSAHQGSYPPPRSADHMPSPRSGNANPPSLQINTQQQQQYPALTQGMHQAQSPAQHRQQQPPYHTGQHASGPSPHGPSSTTIPSPRTANAGINNFDAYNAQRRNTVPANAGSSSNPGTLTLRGPSNSGISTSALLPGAGGYPSSSAFPYVSSVSESTGNSASTVNIASSSTAPYAPPSNTEQLLTAPVAPAIIGPSLADGPGLYSTTGFDMVGVLARVAARKDPKTVLGPVDLSCSFTVVDIRKYDSPIVYASPTFTSLTGYELPQILGRNCRFLQSPDGEVVKGSKRKYTDNVAVAHLKRMLNAGKECQASLINYRRGGIPFINLVTVVPIPWEGTDIVYHVGFQVDLVEQPNAILRNMRDGSYQVNYTVANPPQPPMRPAGRELGASGLSPDILDIMGQRVNSVNFGQGEEGAKMDWLKMVLENSDDFIHVLSLKGMFQYVSPSVRRVLQYEPEDLLNKNISDICHPSDIVPLMRELKDSTHAPTEGSNIRHVNLVFRIRHKHSGYVWIECAGRLHVEPGKGRKAVILSGRARSVPSLPWEIISRHGGLGEKEFWAKLSFQGLILHATSTVSDVLGQRAEDIIGHSFFSILPGGDNGPPHPSMLEHDPASPVSVVANAFQAATSAVSKRDGGVMITHKLVKRSGELVDVITILYALKSRPELPHRSESDGEASTTSSSSGDSPSSSNSGSGHSSLRPTSIVAQVKLLSGSNIPNNLLPSCSTSSSSSLNGGTIANLTNARPVAHAGTSNLFEELETTRGTSWQYELHQLRLLNRRLKDDVLAARSVARANAAKGKGRKRKVGEEMGPPPPPNAYSALQGGGSVKIEQFNTAAPRHQMAPGFGLMNPNMPNPYF